MSPELVEFWKVFKQALAIVKQAPVDKKTPITEEFHYALKDEVEALKMIVSALYAASITPQKFPTISSPVTNPIEFPFEYKQKLEELKNTLLEHPPLLSSVSTKKKLAPAKIEEKASGLTKKVK